jgi:hypothetical protein
MHTIAIAGDVVTHRFPSAEILPTKEAESSDTPGEVLPDLSEAHQNCIYGGVLLTAEAIAAALHAQSQIWPLLVERDQALIRGSQGRLLKDEERRQVAYADFKKVQLEIAKGQPDEAVSNAARELMVKTQEEIEQSQQRILAEVRSNQTRDDIKNLDTEIKRTQTRISVSLASELPQLYGYEAPADFVQTFGGRYHWKPEWKRLSESSGRHLRLVPTGQGRSTELLPKPMSELDKALASDGLFELNQSGQRADMAIPRGADFSALQVLTQVQECPDVVVFQDLNSGFRRLSLSEPPNTALNVIPRIFDRLNIAIQKAQTTRLPLMKPVVICAIKGDPVAIGTVTMAKDADTPWNRLYESEPLSARTILLLDAEELRSGTDPLAISTGLSWERTAQDTIFELRRDERFRRLMSFGQIIVRYGVTGALHIIRRGTNEWSYTLHFDPAHHDSTWTTKSDGIVLGRTAVFVAALIACLNEDCHDHLGYPMLGDLATTIGRGIDTALAACRQLSEWSYGKDGPKPRVSYDSRSLFMNVFCDVFTNPQASLHEEYSPNGENRTKEISSSQTGVPPVSLRKWSILSQESQFCITKVARDIVQRGVAHVINNPDYKPKIAAPVVRFGKTGTPDRDERIVIVDRREIEGFRAIQKLMSNHVANVSDERKKQRPLSFAVFGPPGSGKSTAVRKIADSLSDGSTKFQMLDPFNLSQFSRVEQLVEAFAKISNTRGAIPIAFFDEFDSRFGDGEGQPLGWLKLFLSPMEDGQFGEMKVNNAILVFAGGTSSTFSEFSLATRAKTDDQWIEFSKAKGPDFVSRLRGHLDVVGINPGDPDDELYLIRRAILIRSILSDLQNLTQSAKAKIDHRMVHALLHVPEYRHGGRAVRMLLEQCESEGRISVSAVPPIHQLNMLVDGKAFQDLLTNAPDE